MTLEEALSASEVNDTGADEVITIDNDLRKITIPASITLLGVVSDENVQTLHFQMPKTYKGLDLSEFAIRINYMNANNVGDTYAVDDSEISGESIVFTWTVGRVACMYKGNTKFIICLKKKDTSGNVLKEFNTSLTSLPVLEGLETTEAVVAENPDIIEQILTKIEKLTQISPEDIASAVSAYMEANPIDIPDTLPNPQALTIKYGNKTHTYDGNEALAITIETGGIERIEKLATDTTVTLEPNKLYVFPEMESLTYTIAEGTGEIHFIFKSGATATRVVHPSNVNIGNFSVESNKVYEVSILEGLLTSQNWSVS
jgi:hypothetical protein|nr:MAG TPA: hypothetical protein [Caudoviricetes sp.]